MHALRRSCVRGYGVHAKLLAAEKGVKAEAPPKVQWPCPVAAAATRRCHTELVLSVRRRCT
jgi:hypothetical protein